MLAIDPSAPNGAPPMSDLAPMHTERSIVSVAHDSTGVTVTWDDHVESRFSALWLRDNCACVQCRHPKALERTHEFVDHARPEVTDAVLGPDQAPFEKRNPLVEHAGVADAADVATRHIRQPEEVVGEMGPHAASAGRMPPVLHVAFAELVAGRAE